MQTRSQRASTDTNKQADSSVEIRCGDCDTLDDVTQCLGGFWCKNCKEKSTNDDTEYSNDDDTKERKKGELSRTEKRSPKKSDSKSKSPLFWLATVLILIGGVAWSSYENTYFTNYVDVFKSNVLGIISVADTDQILDCTNTEVLHNNLKLIAGEFSSQERKTWLNFISGIENVFSKNPNEPTTFLMLYNDTSKTAACLADKISKFAAKCIPSGKVIKVTGSELKKEFPGDSGEFLVKYQPEILKSGVMYVDGFHEVPGEIAKEFHYLSDQYQPAVGRAIYLFTMPVDKFSSEKLVQTAENQLKQIWGNSLDRYILDPFITRITGNVIKVINEQALINCS